MINIDNKYDFGQIVYLLTDKEQSSRIVTSIKLLKNYLIYELTAGITVTQHYDFEISETINELITL